MLVIASPSTSLYVETGRRIQEARKAKRVTQERLATAIGLSRASMSNIEGGRHKILLHTLAKIGDVLGVDVHDLLPPRRRSDSKVETQVPSDVSPLLKDFIRKMERGLTKEHKRTATS